MLDRISLILVIIGAINWGAIGLFQFDLVAWLFGGQGAIISRIVYTLVALAGIWCLSLLFRRNEILVSDDVQNKPGRFALPGSFYFILSFSIKSFLGVT